MTRTFGRSPAARTTSLTATSDARTCWFAHCVRSLTQLAGRSPNQNIHPSEPTIATAASTATTVRNPPRTSGRTIARIPRATNAQAAYVSKPAARSPNTPASHASDHAIRTPPVIAAGPSFGSSSRQNHRIAANAPSPTSAIGAAVAFMNR